LSRALGDAEQQLAWTTRSGRALCPYGEADDGPRGAWVLGLQYAF
jgi:hypothetical protein